MIVALIGLAVGLLSGVVGLLADRRTDAEKLASSRRALGCAVGVPTMFDRREV